ncbi:PASTA domain-containing protein [Pseudoclavibacter sp. CFCC 13611]|uniref:PASTA domain-containing protein n=1 Tax=Pseudoclavibacter sp. CFCC 13611 TaxID=2615178 RepID=UPI00178799AC|nr:PASTA domain-containing protein [Pseudoclavibacter sp. CFCC 13611]
MVAAAGVVGCGEEKKNDAAASPSAVGVTIPDLSGQKGNSAKQTIESVGLRIKWDGGDKTVLAPENWTVVSTDPAAPNATDEDAPEAPEPAVSERLDATPSGLTFGGASVACTQAGKAQFPYGVKAHWIIGMLDDRVVGDSRVVKATTTIKNAYGTKRKDQVVECHVSGSDAAPRVDSITVS